MFTVSKDIWTNDFKLPTNIKKDSSLVAGFVPHAGSKESLFLASELYLKFNYSKFDTILIISTCHSDVEKNGVLPNFSSISFNGNHFNVNQTLRNVLKQTGLELNKRFFSLEHSWRVQIGILDKVLSSAEKERIKILPVLLRRCTPELVECIKKNMKRVLLICNSDLIHCGKPGWQKCSPETPHQDFKTLSIVQYYLNSKYHCSLNPDASFFTHNESPFCGPACAYLLMSLGNRMPSWRALCKKYTCCCSSLIHADSSPIHVGYGMIEVNNKMTKRIKWSEIPRIFMENYLFKKDVLQNYQNAIDDFIKENFRFQIAKKQTPKSLFVTISKNGKLRGCIGTYELCKSDNLFKMIAKYTYQAAFHDIRFSPMLFIELKDLTYKINLNSPLETITSEVPYSFITIGLHGIKIEFSDGRAATYLASVMVDYFKFKKGQIMTEEQWRTVKESLKEKCGSVSSDVKKIYRYECIELKEGE